MSTLSESVSPEEFDLYFGFNPPTPEAALQHWTGERYDRFFQALGVGNPQVADEHVQLIYGCYDQPSRFLHIAGPEKGHPEFVANVELQRPPDLPEKPVAAWLRASGTRYANLNRAEAVMGIAADPHDAGYMNIDAAPNGDGAFSPELTQLLNGVATPKSEVVGGERIHRVELSDKDQDLFTQLTARIFGVPESGHLTHKEGGNEFVSALAAVQLMKKHGVDGQEETLETVDVVAVAAIIACTIPFRPNAGVDEQGNITNGFVEEIGRRVAAILLEMGYSPADAWRTTNAIMIMGVEVANRDTAPFTKHNNWAGLTNGARELKLEEVIWEGKHILREPQTTISGLMFAAWLMKSAPGLYQKFLQGDIPLDQVPKIFIPFDDEGKLTGFNQSYPPLPVHEKAVANTRENVRLSSIFFQLHELGIAFAAVMATLIKDPHAEVPGVVNAALQHLTIAPLKVPSEALQALQTAGNDGAVLYEELAKGTHQADLGEATTKNSPMSAFILATAGLRVALGLSDLVQRHREETRTAGEKHVYSGYEKGDPESPGAFLRAQEYRQALSEGIGSINHDRLVWFLIFAAVESGKLERAKELSKFLIHIPPQGNKTS